MYLNLKLILLLFTSLGYLCRISTAPTNSTYKENFQVVQKLSSVSPKSFLSLNDAKQNNASNCISLWDVDAELIKHGRRDKDQTMKFRGNARNKRFNLKETFKKVSKGITKTIDKNKEPKLKEKKKQKRSASMVNLVCTKTGTGVQCHNNNTEVVFNDADITEDMIKESIQALLSNGALDVKEDAKKKKTRGCGCSDGNQQTPVWCSTVSTTCEPSTEATLDDCFITPEVECVTTTIGPCQRNLAIARTAYQETTTECADTTPSPSKPTVCDPASPNGHVINKAESKSEFVPTMYLECTIEDASANPAVYSCRWKTKS